MLLGSEKGGGVEPADYPLARERRHPGLCLVDRDLPSSAYTLKDKVSPLGSVRNPTPAAHGVIARYAPLGVHYLAATFGAGRRL